MAGIYIHIPFCKTRCIYCDFYTITNETRMDDFVKTVCIEAQLRKKEIAEFVHTVYFGGGTPSRLNANHFEQIFETLFREYAIDPNAEITLEVNPDDLTSDYLAMLHDFPFNRLSMGIQSFDENELKFLGRRHSARQAIDSVAACQQNGFDNISIDLMYGLPNQTIEIWEKNLHQAIALDVQHISAYHLIYEDHTRLEALRWNGKVHAVDEELSNQMFLLLIERLTENGFEHYEISNFAKNGLYSQHNTAYWRDEKYLGLGPAAHSFDGQNRSWNVASLTRYIEAINSGTLPSENEYLDIYTQYNEFILTRLRTMWGANIQQLKAKFGEELFNYCLMNAQKYLENHLLKIENGNLKLTRKGIFISDGIMSDLMWVR
jgi:oxygen-independent coproporphyrinogen-3 oxidase